jgi:nicotinamide riboside kinase
MNCAYPRLVCLLGAECTGKTTLARQLAERLGGVWVPEMLRACCDQHGRTPQQDEQRAILHQQHALALATAWAQPIPAWVFCDTGPLQTAVYSELVFGDTSLYAEALALHAAYTDTLLLEPDLGWRADGLQRDGAYVQIPVTRLLEHALQRQPVAWQRVAGLGPQRLAQAMAALPHALQNP